MGCDIHGLCEVKQNGVWKANTRKVFKNPYYASPEVIEERKKKHPNYEPADWEMEEFQEKPSTSRNYDWFAILADVRNGVGFAAIPTGDGFSVIAEPRGVPGDCTEEWQHEVDQWRGDMHSHSYLYLEDFDSFDWGQKTRRSGVVPLDQYLKLRGTGNSPEVWSSYLAGPNIIITDMETADKIALGESVVLVPYNPSRVDGRMGKGELVSLESGHKIHVNYIWEIEYRDWFSQRINDVIEPMRKLKEEYEDVRYVFGFDN